MPIRTLAPRYELLRHQLADGEQTTVYVVRYPRRETWLSIEHFAVPQPLDRWCRLTGIREAIVGGFFLRPQALRWASSGSTAARSRPNPSPTPTSPRGPRSTSRTARSGSRLARTCRPGPPATCCKPARRSSATGRHSAASTTPRASSLAPTSSTPTSPPGRHPRAALAISDEELTALVCDGRRTGIDAGLTLTELAELIVGLGAQRAINLDGGGSSALIHRGHLLNRPYDGQDRPSSPRPIASAAIFTLAAHEQRAAPDAA